MKGGGVRSGAGLVGCKLEAPPCGHRRQGRVKETHSNSNCIQTPGHVKQTSLALHANVHRTAAMGLQVLLVFFFFLNFLLLHGLRLWQTTLMNVHQSCAGACSREDRSRDQSRILGSPGPATWGVGRGEGSCNLDQPLNGHRTQVAESETHRSQ